MKGNHKNLFFILAVVFTLIALVIASPVMAESGIFKDKIKIGTYLAFTGPAAGVGKTIQAGIQSYLNEVNKQGGIHGRKIEMLYEDDAYQPAKTIAATKKLVEVDEVFALLSPAGAPTTLAALPYIVEQKVPLLFPYAPDTGLVDPFKKNVFMITPVFYTQYYYIADYAIRVLGAKKIVQISQAGSPSGPQSVNDRLKEAGLSVVGEEVYKITETDFSSMIMRLKNKNPDFCVFGTITRPGSLMAKEAQKQGWKPTLGFMSHASITDVEFVRLAGEAAEGFLALEVMKSPDSNDPEVVEFRERLKKYYPDIEPGMFAMYGYVSAKIFCEAMKKAGKEPNRDKLITAIESMSGVNIGFMAPLTFSPTQHQGNMNARVVKVKGGKWIPITGWLKLPNRVK